ncbi:MAG: stalk domain-containing protein [Bacillota bacterium]
MSFKRNLVSSLLALSLMAAQPVSAMQVYPGTTKSTIQAAYAGPSVENTITRSEFLSAIIRESGLNLDSFRFIKAPDVRDVATDVSPEAPYAHDLIIAGFYGVVEKGLPFRPDDPVARQEAAIISVKALYAKTGPLPLTMQYIIFEDAVNIGPEYTDSVQDACKLGFFKVERDFRPENRLSRTDYIKLIAAFKSLAKSSQKNQDGVTYTLSGDKKAITLFWGEKPTGGYSINIVSFTRSGSALKVYYDLKSPGPGDIVTMAITYPQTTAALPAEIVSFDEVILVKAHKSNPKTVFNIGKNLYTKGTINIKMDAAPFLEKGRAFVPVRYLALALGVPEDKITWSPSSGTVTLVKEHTTITMAPGGNVMYINDQPVTMDVSPIIKKGRVYLPAKFIAQALGYSIEWDNSKQAVLIYR